MQIHHLLRLVVREPHPSGDWDELIVGSLVRFQVGHPRRGFEFVFLRWPLSQPLAVRTLGVNSATTTLDLFLAS